MIYNNLFTNENPNYKRQIALAFLFPIFTVLALGIDSVLFTNKFFDARQITNVLALGYFSLLFYSASSQLRKLMFTMVFLSYVGELIFCKLLGMYEYRTNAIPLYVPLGHAIVYASGYIFSNTSWAVKNKKKLGQFFAISFAIVFLSVGLFLNDIFSMISGVLFFLLLKRKRWQNMYYFIALCVIFIELIGTFFECWTWVPKIFDVIPTVNPPVGAVFYYGGGDVLVAKIVQQWEKKKAKIKPQII